MIRRYPNPQRHLSADGPRTDERQPQRRVDIDGAALSLGIGQGEPLVQDLGDHLGLDKREIETGGSRLQGRLRVLGR